MLHTARIGLIEHKHCAMTADQCQTNNRHYYTFVTQSRLRAIQSRIRSVHIYANRAVGPTDCVRVNAAALIEISPDLTPIRILKVIGGLQNAGDTSGTASLEFVTHNEIVFMFGDYVSNWQIIVRRSHGLNCIDLEELAD